ncbi:MAG: histidine phosphatase family protein [Candidatus Fonsibacter sp.]|nr:histidine phosphatase family protein [Pelagibacterales bacterium]
MFKKFLLVIYFFFLSFTTVFAEENKVILELKKGEKIVLIRHALAPGLGDPSNFDLSDCKTQRNLSEEGINQSKRVGVFFKSNSILIDKVYSSEWCRCKDTAKYAFGEFTTFSGLNSFFRDSSKGPAHIKSVKNLVNNWKSSKNLVLVTHHVTIGSLTNYYPNSGEIVVTDKSFKVIGSVKIN